MTYQSKRDGWQQDIEDRQKNIVFPDTVQNEARFWRNLGNTPSKTSTKVGVAILAIFVAAWITTILLAIIQAHAGLILAGLMLLIWGPIFAALAWATRRSLRTIKKSGHGPGALKR
jgi:hypothetical protein